MFDATANFFNVTDSARGLISRYDQDPTGNSVGQFGTPGSTGHVPAVGGIELFFPSSGHGTLTADSTTAFADTRNNSLKTLTTDTIENTTGATPTTAIAGTRDGQLYYPESVSSFSDTANYVLAANTLNHRVEVFSNVNKVLTFRANFGSP